MTPSQARNAIKRALIEIIDPDPSKPDIKAMWKHFSSACAFCGVALDPKTRLGHTDHLIPSTRGGRNHLFNRVLACATCNGDQKLDKDWVRFLSERDPQEFTRREALIVAWQETHRAQCSVSEDTVAAALVAAQQALEAFNQACDTVRALRSAKTRIPSKQI